MLSYVKGMRRIAEGADGCYSQTCWNVLHTVERQRVRDRVPRTSDPPETDATGRRLLKLSTKSSQREILTVLLCPDYQRK